MKVSLRILAVSVAALVFIAGGCESKRPLALESHLRDVHVGETTSNQLLGQLGPQKVRHSTNSVSLVYDKGWATEMAVVQFNEEDSLVKRKVYLQMRSRSKVFYTQETLYLDVETVLADAVLDEPYEDTMRKQIAILKTIHQAIIDDTRPFKDEQQVVALMGLARSAIGAGIQQLQTTPRRADELTTPSGFGYEHPTLGGVSVQLNFVSDKVYQAIVRASDKVDSVNHW